MKAALTMTLPDLASLLARVAEAARRKRGDGQDAPVDRQETER